MICCGTGGTGWGCPLSPAPMESRRGSGRSRCAGPTRINGRTGIPEVVWIPQRPHCERVVEILKIRNRRYPAGCAACDRSNPQRFVCGRAHLAHIKMVGGRRRQARYSVRATCCQLHRSGTRRKSHWAKFNFKRSSGSRPVQGNGRCGRSRGHQRSGRNAGGACRNSNVVQGQIAQCTTPAARTAASSRFRYPETNFDGIVGVGVQGNR